MAVSSNTLNLLNFRNCKRCGKAFSTMLDYTVCPTCMEQETQRFNRTRDYIYNHGDASEEDIIEHCHITADELSRWIREEKITLGENSNIKYPCESCGSLISGGHFCLDCKLKLHAKTVKQDNPMLTNNSMHHFHRNL